jgi:glycosyltransferase involved in cell wall biosynthesis
MVGGGVERQALEERAKADGLHNVVFLPKRPVEEIGVLLCQADALLVHLKNDPLFAITIPSRIQGYLAMGRPILCGLRGDGASLVKAARSGICFEPENAASMVDAVRAMLALSEEERQAMGAQGKAFYLANLSVQVGTKAFIELFSDVLARWKR